MKGTMPTSDSIIRTLNACIEYYYRSHIVIPWTSGPIIKGTAKAVQGVPPFDGTKFIQGLITSWTISSLISRNRWFWGVGGLPLDEQISFTAPVATCFLRLTYCHVILFSPFTMETRWIAFELFLLTRRR